MKTGVLTKAGRTLIGEVLMADRFWTRAVGLLGRDSLGTDRALFLAPCASIHTFFMRFPLDLVFLGPAMRVVKVVRDVRPFRIVSGGFGALGVLELQAGWLSAEAVQPGDELSLVVS